MCDKVKACQRNKVNMILTLVLLLIEDEYSHPDPFNQPTKNKFLDFRRTVPKILGVSILYKKWIITYLKYRERECNEIHRTITPLK